MDRDADLLLGAISGAGREAIAEAAVDIQRFNSGVVVVKGVSPHPSRIDADAAIAGGGCRGLELIIGVIDIAAVEISTDLRRIGFGIGNATGFDHGAVEVACDHGCIVGAGDVEGGDVGASFLALNAQRCHGEAVAGGFSVAEGFGCGRRVGEGIGEQTAAGVQNGAAVDASS